MLSIIVNYFLVRFLKYILEGWLESLHIKVFFV